MPKNYSPTFQPMDIPIELYQAVCARMSQEFADSYLTGAKLEAGRLTARTQTAHAKMSDSFDFRRLLKDAGITLVRPLPFQDQPDGKVSAKMIWRQNP